MEAVACRRQWPEAVHALSNETTHLFVLPCTPHPPAGGELPHAQACVLYLLRSVLVPALPERSQRALLTKLTGAAAGAVAPPLVVCALEGMGVLLEVLGEVVEEEGLVEEMRGVVLSKLAMSSSAVRHQVRFMATKFEFKGNALHGPARV